MSIRSRLSANAAISLARRAARLGRRLLADNRGVSFATVVFMMPILIAFVGLAIDVGVWQAEKHELQGAADRAAFSAATAAQAGASKSQATTEGKGTMAAAGFADGTNGVAITINSPASMGSYTSDPAAYEVLVSKPQNLFFSGVFLDTPPTIAVRAVATKGKTASSGCILTLDASAAYATTFTNNAEVIDDNCAVYTNSSSASALLCDNNCNINSSTYTVGGNLVRNHGTLAGPTNDTGVALTPDPYAAIVPPASSTMTCTQTAKLTINANQTINPGVYCGGIDVKANKVLTMNPGTYYVKKLFNMGGNSTLNADGVTIVLLDDACLGDGTCIKEKGLGNNITVNLTAPTTGYYAGIAIYAQGTKSTRQEFSNNATLNIQGALYAPGDLFTFHNNALFNNNLCAQVVSAKVNFENNASMGTNCDDTGVKQILGSGKGKKTKLVE